MSLDLERLLNHQQELQLIKQVIQGKANIDNMATDFSNMKTKRSDESTLKPIVFSKRDIL